MSAIPIYRDYRIDFGPAYTADTRWEFVHDDYDGAPNNPGEGPADNRAGFGCTVEDCREQIDEIEEDRAERSAARAVLRAQLAASVEATAP